MIDVIIPAYNAHATITRTLYSIASQKIVDQLNVYIVNDCSKKDYQEEIKKFSNFMKIKELKTEENKGPGYARQYGIDHSNSKYIVFIDSDDTLYDYYSLYVLLKEIENSKADLVISAFWEEQSTQLKIHCNEMFFMHGKIYKRSFLTNNKIRFFDTRSDEDTGFNQLVQFHNPKVKYIDIITYIWTQNKNSISRSSDLVEVVLKNYIINMELAINEGIKRNINKKELDKSVVSCIATIYYFYIFINDNRLLDYLKNMYTLYKKVELTEEEENQSIRDIFLYEQNYREKLEIYNPSISFKQFVKLLEEQV